MTLALIVAIFLTTFVIWSFAECYIECAPWYEWVVSSIPLVVTVFWWFATVGIIVEKKDWDNLL
jgi:hypothetical protein